MSLPGTSTVRCEADGLDGEVRVVDVMMLIGQFETKMVIVRMEFCQLFGGDTSAGMWSSSRWSRAVTIQGNGCRKGSSVQVLKRKHKWKSGSADEYYH